MNVENSSNDCVQDTFKIKLLIHLCFKYFYEGQSPMEISMIDALSGGPW